MAPKSGAFRQLQRRMRRTLNYGSRRMQNLPLPLSELVVDYFDKRAPYDYMAMDFATTLARDGCVDAFTFLVAMVYVDRVRVADKAYFETSDPNDVYLSALVVASKFLYDGGLDEFVYNDEWAASASTSLNRVNELELKILDILSWDVNVSEKEFEHVLHEAECWVARNAFSKRGFLTYNETAILSSKMCLFGDILLPFISVFSSLLIIYSALILSMLVIPKVALSHRNFANESYVELKVKGLLNLNVGSDTLCTDLDCPRNSEAIGSPVIKRNHPCDFERKYQNGIVLFNYSHEMLQSDLINRLIPFIPFRSFT